MRRRIINDAAEKYQKSTDVDKSGCQADLSPSNQGGIMEGKVILVTGANAGIGLGTAIELATLGAKVYIGCRSESRGQAAVQQIQSASSNSNIYFLPLDLNDLNSVDACARQFAEQESHLDVLINNAGIMAVRTDDRSAQGFERTLAVNFLGHFLLTVHLLPLLQAAKAPKVLNLSSLTHGRGRVDFNTLEYWRMLMQEGRQDLNECPLYTRSSLSPNLDSLYSTSKLAILLFSCELSDRFQKAGIRSNAVCPGIVATNILDDFGWFIRTFGPSVMRLISKVGYGVTVEYAAQKITSLLTTPQYETLTGRYFTHGKEKNPALVGVDQVAGKRLWQIAEDLVEIHRRVPHYQEFAKKYGQDTTIRVDQKDVQPVYNVADWSMGQACLFFFLGFLAFFLMRLYFTCL